MVGAGCATRILFIVFVIFSHSDFPYPRAIGASKSERGKISRAQRYKIQWKIENLCERKSENVSFTNKISEIEHTVAEAKRATRPISPSVRSDKINIGEISSAVALKWSVLECHRVLLKALFSLTKPNA